MPEEIDLKAFSFVVGANSCTNVKNICKNDTLLVKLIV